MHPHTHARARAREDLCKTFLFHGNNGFVNALQYYDVRKLPVWLCSELEEKRPVLINTLIMNYTVRITDCSLRVCWIYLAHGGDL